MHTRKVLGKVSTGLEAEKSQPGGGALKTTPPTSAFKSLKAKNVLKAEICWVSLKPQSSEGRAPKFSLYMHVFHGYVFTLYA